MLYSCLGPKVIVYLVRNVRRVSIRCAAQCSKFARKMEHFCTFIHPHRAAIVTMVGLDWLLMGNDFNCRCEKWSARKHQKWHWASALWLFVLCVFSNCLVCSKVGAARKNISPWLAKEIRQIKRVKHSYSFTMINVLIEGITGHVRI